MARLRRAWFFGDYILGGRWFAFGGRGPLRFGCQCQPAAGRSPISEAPEDFDEVESERGWTTPAARHAAPKGSHIPRAIVRPRWGRNGMWIAYPGIVPPSALLTPG